MIVVLKEAAVLDLTGKEVTFLIKKSMSGRIGWKIMPEDDNLNLKINATILEQVMNRIRWEMSGGKFGTTRKAFIRRRRGGLLFSQALYILVHSN